MDGRRRRHPALEALLRAKAESDRGNYPAKHEILRALIAERPGDFAVDSRLGRYLGLTHRGTRFRIHLPADALPGGVSLEEWRSVPAKVAALVEDALGAGGAPPPLVRPAPEGNHTAFLGPHPMSRLLAGGLIGAGVGHLGGQLLGGSRRARKGGTAAGALLGAAAPAYWAWLNLRSPEAGPTPHTRLTSGFPFRDIDRPAPPPPAPVPDLPPPKTAGEALARRRAVRAAASPANPLRLKLAAESAGAAFSRTIPVDAFNRAVWLDVEAPANPWGTRDPLGDNSGPLRTPPPVAAAVSGIVSGAGAAYRTTRVSPWEVGVAAAAASGAGYVAGLGFGRVLGALAGMSPEEQAGLRRAGLWGGLVTGAARALFDAR